VGWKGKVEKGFFQSNITSRGFTNKNSVTFLRSVTSGLGPVIRYQDSQNIDFMSKNRKNVVEIFYFLLSS
jgi:hypothetical protein